MKIKTKLIASIMSICLVCAVFAIGVFALRTANLKIGGDVSFTATGVEATINKVAVTANSVADEANHFKSVTIDTTQTQSDIDSSENASSWSGLDITIGEAGKVDLDVSVTNNADTITEKNNYIEVDKNVSLGTGNNVKITMSPKTIDEHVSDYIIAPGETDYYTISFVVEDIELNAKLEGFSFGLVLNHAGVVGGTVNGTKLTGTDGVVYTLDSTTYTASLGNDGSGNSIGDNYEYNGNPNLTIASVVTDGINNYVVTTIEADTFMKYGNGNQLIESVIIPNSVTSIGTHAFYNCCLNSVIIGDGVTSISSYVFAHCYGLTSIVIPESVTSIGSCVFQNCTGLTSAKFENPTGWFTAATADATSGTPVEVTSTFTEDNANVLKNHSSGYLLRKDA
ncbi:MAG: leucine-rich repeat domain-containing protein [Clostridia bacterium]|nr:leucine-rich repeat domain-containing protein [Clostridia bacterium]